MVKPFRQTLGLFQDLERGEPSSKSAPEGQHDNSPGSGRFHSSSTPKASATRGALPHHVLPLPILAARTRRADLSRRSRTKAEVRRRRADYLDTAPLPAPGTSAVWKYKAIYRLGDDPARRDGQWSDVVSIPVAG